MSAELDVGLRAGSCGHRRSAAATRHDENLGVLRGKRPTGGAKHRRLQSEAECAVLASSSLRLRRFGSIVE